jgi:hypothetical protein
MITFQGSNTVYPSHSFNTQHCVASLADPVPWPVHWLVRLELASRRHMVEDPLADIWVLNTATQFQVKHRFDVVGYVTRWLKCSSHWQTVVNHVRQLANRSNGQFSWQFWGSDGGENNNVAVLGFDVMWTRRKTSMFRLNTPFPPWKPEKTKDNFQRSWTGIITHVRWCDSIGSRRKIDFYTLLFQVWRHFQMIYYIMSSADLVSWHAHLLISNYV